MFGILIVTHGQLSEGLVDASNMIFGEQDYLETLMLNPEDEVELLNTRIQEAYARVNKGKGVLIFTDLISASPFNQSTLAIRSLSEEEQAKIFILTGVNLPMLLEAINQNLLNTEIEEAIEKIKQSGKNGIEEWSIGNVLNSDDDDDGF